MTRTDPNLAAEGAVAFLERVSPALEQIDSSSGAIGSAVNSAIVDLVAIIADAPAERRTREKWLDRLWAAHEADAIPYIETLADYWGDLCASKEVASAWADQLVGITRMALSPDPKMRGHFHGTSACLSALFRAERYAEIIDILKTERFWQYTQWAVKAHAARGEKADLAADTPGEEGKWFAAAKEARLYDVALDLARRSPCDPRTLVRAARDFAARQPAFAVEAGLLALHWIVEGHGYEITGRDVLDAFTHTMQAAEINGASEETRERIGQLVGRDAPDGIVRRILEARHG